MPSMNCTIAGSRTMDHSHHSLLRYRLRHIHIHYVLCDRYFEQNLKRFYKSRNIQTNSFEKSEIITVIVIAHFDCNYNHQNIHDIVEIIPTQENKVRRQLLLFHIPSNEQMNDQKKTSKKVLEKALRSIPRLIYS